ncbi:MAG: high-potential iron-sulfur protein [Rhodanobacteraceae bacterium]|nr:high-potential iron-sulfur protein [Rhodanobacteraceae bacterium]
MKTPANAPSESHAVLSRRRFLATVAVAGAAFALPAAADLAPLPETDPTAQALGYKADGSQVDAAKFPKHTPQQQCANCNFYQGTAAVGPCQLFPGKSVTAKGWCSAYVAKA